MGKIYGKEDMMIDPGILSTVTAQIFAYPTVYPRGTTIYKPEKCYNGYTIFVGRGRINLIDMNGRVVHEWEIVSTQIKGGTPRARLLRDGHVLVGRSDGIQEYDWDGKVVWEYIPGESWKPHHDVFRKPDGNTLLICREEVPEEYKSEIKDPERRNVPIYSDVILEVSPDRELVWEWHQHEYLDINQCNPIPASRDWWAGPDNNTITDWTHTNTVQALPENKWYDQGDERFKPGNVLISMRQLDTILIVDRDTKEITWSYTGEYKGGMSGQHDSHMIEKGYVGEGNILVFDNGASPYKNLAHAGCSFVLEIDPTTNQVVWVYEDREKFHSNFTSSCQRVRNGNTVVCEAAGSRFFEVTKEGEIVWEYVERSNRVYRYPYDYCAETEAMGIPGELPVIPPEDLRIPPGA